MVLALPKNWLPYCNYPLFYRISMHVEVICKLLISNLWSRIFSGQLRHDITFFLNWWTLLATPHIILFYAMRSATRYFPRSSSALNSVCFQNTLKFLRSDPLDDCVVENTNFVVLMGLFRYLCTLEFHVR